MSQSLRVWERAAVRVGDGRVELPLRFRVVPAIWPDIDLVAPDGTREDVDAAAHEVVILVDPGERGWMQVDVAGYIVVVSGREVTFQGRTIVVDEHDPIRLVILVAAAGASVTINGHGPHDLLDRVAETELDVRSVTENIADFRVGARPQKSGLAMFGGGAVVLEATVFGLRADRSSLYDRAAKAAEPGVTFYSSSSFEITDTRVTGGRGPEAVVTDRQTIVSPIRVVEEFAWRPTPFGDMTRVADRSEIWRSAVEPGRFPSLHTGFRTVDAAFELAIETFQRNSSGEFSLPGERGLWSAGYFQGSGQGFGSWRRDTSHIALRTGNLVDPEVARASLAHVIDSGFDNGSDGDALPAVAVWDYVLATGDHSLIEENWNSLARTAASLDARFDEHRGLIHAPQSTSNDLFDEPEAGGFALSTEVYAMASYQALARMAALPSIQDSRFDTWAQRSTVMRDAIAGEFFNPRHGYFTSGPIGSESFKRGLWETSGAEAALWGYLGDSAAPLTASTLDNLDRVAMSEYGVVLFPYKSADNHFCNSVWYCWQAGIAREAARTGNAALIHQLIAQQVRTAVLHKTFYEVTEAGTGESWRWPGQLWHAAGFVSLILFGLLGARYDETGMAFSPAVAPELGGSRITGLRYRQAILDIEIRGHGTVSRTFLDGLVVDRVPLDVTGQHTVTLELT